jgi:hypothetical protein
MKHIIQIYSSEKFCCSGCKCADLNTEEMGDSLDVGETSKVNDECSDA